MKAALAWLTTGALVGAIAGAGLTSTCYREQDRAARTRIDRLLGDSAVAHARAAASDARVAQLQLEAETEATRADLGAQEAAQAGRAAASQRATNARLVSQVERQAEALAAAASAQDSLTAALDLIQTQAETIDGLSREAALAQKEASSWRASFERERQASASLEAAVDESRRELEAERQRTADLSLELGRARDRTSPRARGRLLGLLPRPECGLSAAITGATLRRLGQGGPEPPMAAWELLGAGCTIGF